MNVTVTDVLGSLFNPTDTVCFRVFDDKKGGVFQGAKLSCECGKYKSVEETLKNHNAMNRGIFFVVNYGGQDDDSITRINAHFVEMDNGSFDEQQKKIDAFPLPPSMVMKTQKSYHVYWFMDSTAKVERFRMIQTQLVKCFDGDPMCVNESRVMRLPGFMHCKKDTPVEVTCVSFHPERKYTQDQLSDVLPEVDLAPVERKCGTEKGIDQVFRSCVFMQHCRDDAASLSEHDWYAMITNLAPFEGGTKMIHDLSAPYPGYSEGNTQKKINHFLESGTNPITCKTICEKGFKCPKFAAGECPVKSPAAWCYQPLPADALLDILHGIPVTGEAIKDLQAAKQFVSDYLYNQDVVMADVIINSEIRDHFKLKASFLKSLNMVFKDASKAYQASKAAKRAKAGTAIDDKILMEYYRLEKEFDGSISLAGAEGGLGGIKGEAGAKIKKSAGLAEIIAAINEKYGTEFTEMDKVLEQIQNDFLADDNLVSFAKNNDEAIFGLKFEQEFENVAAQRYEQNDAFFVKMFQDSDVMKTVIEMLKPIIYRKMRKKK